MAGNPLLKQRTCESLSIQAAGCQALSPCSHKCDVSARCFGPVITLCSILTPAKTTQAFLHTPVQKSFMFQFF
jgi:hypothetical protein